MIVSLSVPPACDVTAPEPSATSPALFATAFGPIATLSAPSAWLSGFVLFAWKYLMPVELIASIAAPTLLTFDVVPSAL
ncbi:tash protein pest motif family [Burkholderia pseudomallei NAU20B-16]|nr:tash protein pest motif family [Burkholderia pseudomallei NAU20B-16]